MHKPHLYSGGRYPVLRALAIIYMLGSVLAVMAGIYTIYWTMTRFHDGMDQIVLVAAACAGTFIVVVSMLAAAEVLKLFIDVEHNTRVAALAATQRYQQQQTAAAGDGAAAAAAAAPVGNGGTGRISDFSDMDEETAEAALLRGH